MRVHPGQLISLGHGAYARSDEVVAIEPIVESRGPGRRARVWVRGLPEALIASRAEESLVRDLVAPADQVTRLEELSAVLGRVVSALGSVPPVLLRVLEEETSHDFERLADEARRALDGSRGPDRPRPARPR